MSIFEVRHQPRAHRMIQRAMMSRRMPHAYLFVGPEGVGREMFAVRLAKTLLCSDPMTRPLPTEFTQGETKIDGQDACGQCQDCRLVEAGTHPDLHLIYRQLNRQHPDATIRKQKALFLGVDVVRNFLVDRTLTRPNRGRAKVFVVREAERLNDAAQNSLLKTLEEPPADTFIILVASALDRLFPTIRSRCQQVVFQPLPAEFVAERLRTLRSEVPHEVIGYIARHAGGSLGLALRRLDDGLYPRKRAWGEQLAAWADAEKDFAPHTLAGPFLADAKQLAKGVTERDPDVSETDATRAGLQTLLSVLSDFYLDAMRQREGKTCSIMNEDQPEIVDRLAARHTRASLMAMIRHLSEADANLGRNAHVELALEAMFIQLARTARPPYVDATYRTCRDSR